MAMAALPHVQHVRPTTPRGAVMGERTAWPALALLLGLCWLGLNAAQGAEAPAITPWPDPATLTGSGIVPGQLSFNPKQQRRPLVFFLGYDAATRVVTLRTVERGETITATLLPHAEIYYHAERGGIADFRPWQTLRVRLHPDQDGRWRLATYLLDDLWHLSGHRQYQRIDALAPDGAALTCTVVAPEQPQQTPPAPAQVEAIHLTPQTRYWRAGRRVDDPALAVGMRIRCDTYGAANGSERYAEDVVLDDQSLEQCFIATQRQRQQQRLDRGGYPGYVQTAAAGDLAVLLFRDVAKPAAEAFPVGAVVRVQALAWSGQGSAAPVGATVTESRPAGLGWQVRLRGAFTAADWLADRTALVFAPVPAAP
jgi:hypothetical protein